MTIDSHVTLTGCCVCQLVENLQENTIHIKFLSSEMGTGIADRIEHQRLDGALGAELSVGDRTEHQRQNIEDKTERRRQNIEDKTERQRQN